MRYLLLFLLYPTFFIYSQKSKSDSTFEYTYFKNGKISTKRLLTTEKIHFGYFKAFKIDGTEIYNTYTRNVGGHSSVYVDYYPNGAIKKAHATDQPDGGIQHGDITHYFDEQGNVTSVVDLGDDGHRRIVTTPTFRQVDLVVPPKKEEKPKVVECAIIYSSEIYVVNFTRKRQVLIATKTPPNGLGFKNKILVNPGDTVIFGSFVEAQMFTPASVVFNAKVETSKKSNSYHLVWDAFIQPKESLRQYYLLLIDKKVR